MEYHASKMTLAQLREQHHFDIPEIARIAVVGTTDVLHALRLTRNGHGDSQSSQQRVEAGLYL